MSIRQFESAQVKAPFLGKPHYPISGLDQLGLNLTSERIFDLLLPGLNNVTQRIRYYSFYCWFFDWYAATIRNTSSTEQNTYLRRSEFLLALIAAHKNHAGIPGITKALKIYEVANDSIDLKLGTQEDQASEGSYWKNPRGVLGQYYINSIKQMGILADQGDKNGLYIRTDFEHDSKVSGKQLAEAFKENTNKTIELFITAIKANEVTKKSLALLSEDFNMLHIPDNTKEQKLLWQLFSGVDRPKENITTFFRQETIKLLLSNINSYDRVDSYNQLNVPLAIYAKGWNSNYSTTEKLWYFFILEQFWSVACTGCLDAFIDLLENKSNNNWIDEIVLLNEIENQLLHLFDSEYLVSNTDSFFDISFLESPIQELVELSKTASDPYFKIIYAIGAIQKLFLENKESIPELIGISTNYKIHTASSFLVVFKDFNTKQHISLRDFIRNFLTKYVINRHHFVALRKLNATQNSAKFYREDGMIKLVDHFNYDYSSPRIHTLLDFMKDLNIVSEDATDLTVLGTNHLDTLAS
jgi:hypothetical protein